MVVVVTTGEAMVGPVNVPPVTVIPPVNRGVPENVGDPEIVPANVPPAFNVTAALKTDVPLKMLLPVKTLFPDRNGGSKMLSITHCCGPNDAQVPEPDTPVNAAQSTNLYPLPVINSGPGTKP